MYFSISLCQRNLVNPNGRPRVLSDVISSTRSRQLMYLPPTQRSIIELDTYIANKSTQFPCFTSRQHLFHYLLGSIQVVVLLLDKLIVHPVLYSQVVAQILSFSFFARIGPARTTLQIGADYIYLKYLTDYKRIS